ncbi:conserved Plasmodium protein, unknown function [Plasmodium yoelii]|uniref:CID domain-containing protein n=3 Tax=Plasmodium yoelii TaxID=5861 RepID=A0AAE9WR72_PLAYO|nr:conserved Plasmodium protein, unknown function [Plasmodium yoelii]EAA20365.1 hypothetical protein [Plasmodium yoelii yoelii]WBY55054.1 hypothetical protein Py17XNL_000303696 [Plasmodium yoelii yoelii]CDU16314.1 conserved Plasmodium protein, unknown function [Plasmodium yoelii]VTZ72586.1 conserved Plasmodium protein, unknown function [Plasmodium yoelii]|eukprot:XP_728800.1 conserved Plasmodium protein, unknown function [Plasmodium yoelii]
MENPNRDNYKQKNISNQEESIKYNTYIKSNNGEEYNSSDKYINEVLEKDKNKFDMFINFYEENKTNNMNDINDWILNKCNKNDDNNNKINYSKVIASWFYDRMLKCLTFKNKLNLIFIYHEIIRNLMLNNKHKEMNEFKKYMNPMIQDVYTCAYYKDQSSISVLLQIVYKWKELNINDNNETKTLLDFFHHNENNGYVDNSYNQKTNKYKYTSDYNINNKYRYNNTFVQNNNIPPPPPPTDPPHSAYLNNESKQFPLNDKYKKKSDSNDISYNHKSNNNRNFFNNSDVDNDSNKNPEDISVGFLATLLKFISKKGKKLQIALVPYTPIEISYTYQTPPSTNITQKLNEKINDFYEELKHIENDEDIESSDVSDTNEVMNAYDNYKKFISINKKKTGGKEGKGNKKCKNNDKLSTDQNKEYDYSSDTNTTFSSVELFDNSMIELLNDDNDNLKKNKKNKNVSFSQIAIENAQNWNEENDNTMGGYNFDFYPMSGMGDNSNIEDVFENYRRNKSNVYHGSIAQKF